MSAQPPDNGWNTRYEKQFHLHSVHFNGQSTYDNWRAFKDAKARGDYQAAMSHLEMVVEDVHGHRFEITVRVDAPIGTDDWAVDDVELTRLVMGWEHKNLSILPEFDDHNWRATTEQMARVLYNKLRDAFPHLTSIIVKVQETADISASYPARW